jgi:hypothetical protein
MWLLQLGIATATYVDEENVNGVRITPLSINSNGFAQSPNLKRRAQVIRRATQLVAAERCSQHHFPGGARADTQIATHFF